MIERNVSILQIPQGKSKLSADENTALDILENFEEKRCEHARNVKAEKNARRVAEYKLQCRRARQQSLFKAIDVAMWSAVFVGILILGAIIL